MSGAGITRAGFPYAMEIQTRWADNDVYGHVNNVVYYAYFDSVINRYLIEQGGLDIESGGADSIHAGLRVARLGRTSASYEIGIFRGEDLCAHGTFVHVFVDRATRKPTPIPKAIRAALERIAVAPC